MASKPMAERRQSDHGLATPFLRPDAASPSPHRLLPSPVPPRTASSDRSQRPQSRVSAVSGNSRDSQSDGIAVRKSHSHSVSSTPRTLASSSRSVTADGRDRQRAVNTLPPWVQSADEDDTADATSCLLPRTPVSARPASHHYMPTPKSNVPGRKFDHIREGAPVTLSTPVSDSASKWKQFTQASNLDRPVSSRGQIVDDDWLQANMPDLEQKWEPIDSDDKDDKIRGFWLFSAANRKRKLFRFHRTIMNHPMVPAVIRMIVLTFSILALALASSIYRRSDNHSCDNNSSTWMAIIVDIVAILYTVYITYDEYTSKPLGLRSHNAKMSLVFLDLAFIVFESANLSLAFQALTDDKWACVESSPDLQACPYTKSICQRQKGLTATLFIALLAWIGTFTISTLRYAVTSLMSAVLWTNWLQINPPCSEVVSPTLAIYIPPPTIYLYIPLYHYWHIFACSTIRLTMRLFVLEKTALLFTCLRFHPCGGAASSYVRTLFAFLTVSVRARSLLLFLCVLDLASAWRLGGARKLLGGYIQTIHMIQVVTAEPLVNIDIEAAVFSFPKEEHTGEKEEA